MEDLNLNPNDFSKEFLIIKKKFLKLILIPVFFALIVVILNFANKALSVFLFLSYVISIFVAFYILRCPNCGSNLIFQKIIKPFYFGPFREKNCPACGVVLNKSNKDFSNSPLWQPTDNLVRTWLSWQNRTKRENAVMVMVYTLFIIVIMVVIILFIVNSISSFQTTRLF